jgi:trimeric autotransporter adhesin
MAAPDLPIIGTATSTGSTTATVAFAAPLDDGGQTITGYTATSSPGNITGTSATSPISITGLSPNTTYTFTVTATNNDGTSGPSQPSNPITTDATAPGAPTIGTATETGTSTISVEFLPPASDGGVAISEYTVTSTPGSVTATGTSSPIVVTGLTSGTSYTFNVTATNTIGTSSPSQESNTATTDYINPNTPGAPTIGTATETGTTTATVAFTAPASDGGYAITSYTAIASPGGITGTLEQAESGTISITGLAPGSSYSFIVFATNSEGAGINSSSSNTITTDAAAPNAPTIGTATKTGATTATVTFTEPSINNGAAVSGYTVTSSPDGITATGNSSPIFVTGLSPASSYTFTVTATNSAGTSDPSSASNQITSDATVPGAPTIGTAVNLTSTSARITFTPPSSNGGASISNYTVTSTPGNIIGSGSASPITVTGLTPATEYTFTVVATNFVGDGPASAASDSITTDATDVFVPDAPTIGTATKTGSTTATVAFTAPASDGGSAILGYIATSTPGNIIASGTSSPISVTGLTPATHYTFVVRAINSVGSSLNSDASNIVNTDTAPPGPPTVGIAAKTGATTATLAFTPPTVTNGQTVIGYTVESTPIGGSGSGATSPILITGLTPATAYTFKIRAITSSSEGEQSNSSNIITTDFGSSANYATLSNQIETIKSKINALTATNLNSEQILYLSKSIVTLSEALGIDDVVAATANAIERIDDAGAATISLVNATANGTAVSNLQSSYTALQATYDNINPRVTSLEGVITNQESNIASASALAVSAGYNPWQIVTANKLLVNRDRVFVNTPALGGGVDGLTLTLPAGPALGYVVEIVDISGNASTNFFTIARNGEKIQGAEEDLIFNVNNKAMKLIYSNTANGWRIA